MATQATLQLADPMRLLEQDALASSQAPERTFSRAQSLEAVKEGAEVPEITDIPAACEEAVLERLEARQLRFATDIRARLEELRSGLLADVDRRFDHQREALSEEVARQVSGVFSVLGSSATTQPAPSKSSDCFKRLIQDVDTSTDQACVEDTTSSSAGALFRQLRADLARHDVRVEALERAMGFGDDDSSRTSSGFSGFGSNDRSSEGRSSMGRGCVDDQMVERIAHLEDLVKNLMHNGARPKAESDDTPSIISAVATEEAPPEERPAPQPAPPPAPVPTAEVAPAIQQLGELRLDETQPLQMDETQQPAESPAFETRQLHEEPHHRGSASPGPAPALEEAPSPLQVMLVDSPRTCPPRRQVRKARFSCVVHSLSPKVPDPALADILARRRSISEGLPITQGLPITPMEKRQEYEERRPPPALDLPDIHSEIAGPTSEEGQPLEAQLDQPDVRLQTPEARTPDVRPEQRVPPLIPPLVPPLPEERAPEVPPPQQKTLPDVRLPAIALVSSLTQASSSTCAANAAKESVASSCKDSLTASHSEIEPSVTPSGSMPCRLLSVSSLSESDHSRSIVLESPELDTGRSHRPESSPTFADVANVSGNADIGDMADVADITDEVDLDTENLMNMVTVATMEDPLDAGELPTRLASPRLSSVSSQATLAPGEVLFQCPSMSSLSYKPEIHQGPREEHALKEVTNAPKIASPPSAATKRMVQTAATPVRMQSCHLPGHHSLLSVIGQRGTLTPIQPVDTRVNVAVAPYRQGWAMRNTAPAPAMRKQSSPKPQADGVSSPPEPQSRSLHCRSWRLQGTPRSTLPPGNVNIMVSSGSRSGSWVAAHPNNHFVEIRTSTPQRRIGGSPTGSPQTAIREGGVSSPRSRRLTQSSSPPPPPPPPPPALLMSAPQSLSATAPAVAAAAAAVRPCCM